MAEPITTKIQESNGGESTALVEKVKYQPMEPIGNLSTLKSLLERNMQSIGALLPKHVTPERITKLMLVAANRNPDLLKCTQSSVLETIQRASELGLDISGTLGEAYPVPFNNRVRITLPNGEKQERWVDQCTLIPGYRGLAKLARQSGEIQHIEAEAVYENDLFEFEKGSAPKMRFVPLLTGGERGKIVGYYALAGFKSGGFQAEFMTPAQVEKVRQNAKSKDSPAWKNHFDEMAKKTVFRRLAKWLPLSSEKFHQAVELDNLDFDTDDLIPAAADTVKHVAVIDLQAVTAGDVPDPQAKPQEDPLEARLLDLNARLGKVVPSDLVAVWAEEKGLVIELTAASLDALEAAVKSEEAKAVDKLADGLFGDSPKGKKG